MTGWRSSPDNTQTHKACSTFIQDIRKHTNVQLLNYKYSRTQEYDYIGDSTSEGMILIIDIHTKHVPHYRRSFCKKYINCVICHGVCTFNTHAYLIKRHPTQVCALLKKRCIILLGSWKWIFFHNNNIWHTYILLTSFICNIFRQ